MVAPSSSQVEANPIPPKAELSLCKLLTDDEPQNSFRACDREHRKKHLFHYLVKVIVLLCIRPFLRVGIGEVT